MKFPRETLLLLSQGESYCDGFEVILNHHMYAGGGYYTNLLVFKYRGNFYETSYQPVIYSFHNEDLNEFDDNEIECQQVWPHDKVITEYLPTPPKSKLDLNLTMTGDEYHAIN